jgi:hypothetical protein
MHGTAMKNEKWLFTVDCTILGLKPVSSVYCVDYGKHKEAEKLDFYVQYVFYMALSK